MFALALLLLAGCASTHPQNSGTQSPAPQSAPAAAAPAPTAAEALARLKAGGARFATGTGDAKALAAGRSHARVQETGTQGQRPFAAILTCADSRTPPEIFLDQGIGDLFVVRVAGNVTDPMGLASLEFGVDALKVPLIVVIGHTRCGAVDAAVQASSAPAGAAGQPTGNLGALVAAIKPAVASARAEGGDPLLPAAIRANVRQSMAELSSRSPVLASRIAAGQVRVVGAVYDITTGVTEWLPER
jgi:carbonic anhydrase